MTSTLKAIYEFNKDISNYQGELKNFINEFRIDKEKKLKQDIQFKLEFNGDNLILEITFESGYPHTILFHLRNEILKNFGRKYSLTIKNISVKYYKLEFQLDKEAINPISIPYVDELEITGKNCVLVFNDITDEAFIKRNFINRIVKRIQEKVDKQYYEGKGEYSEILWSSEKKKMVWKEDPSKVMLDKNWIKQAETKGKWFFGPQLAKVIRAMRKVVFNEIIEPLGFKEVIEPHHEAFSTLLRTGHLEGVPMELYYICEPKTRNPEEWENFIDHLKITREVPEEELLKMISAPNAINCYVQCPNIYEFFSGKTIADEEFPILIFDASAVSNRYESGGRHGIERMDEFHRMELVYIGTKDQLVEVKDKIIDRYK
ncbi:MAG: hypothetical protein EU551_04320, partial [Promethearchaeota archaeon]